MSNPRLELARTLIEETGCNLFLTGKAGTGKTTLLRDLVQRKSKQMVVLAPTGVAAVNAGGQTMHSFFQLPFQPYVKMGAPGAASRNSMLKELRFSREKRDIIRNLELLVIDEVSMVRADMLDAIDDILRYVCQDNTKPFGGIQVLLIGDLYQLPPVCKEEELPLIERHYGSPYFFNSAAFRLSSFRSIELEQIYRQEDPLFIDLLNQIRNNRLDNTSREILDLLSHPQKEINLKHPIRLCTHNYQADQINQREFNNLNYESRAYHAEFSGVFNERNCPGEPILVLKPNCRVMITRNDNQLSPRFYNGKSGIVKELKPDTITLILDDGLQIELERFEWISYEYRFDEDTGEVIKEENGMFKQFPLRLAWAITIHKSQGLTFDEVVVDAGKAFAPGQVYVALSRCKTLTGLALSSKIDENGIFCDPTVLKFMNSREPVEAWLPEIEIDKQLYLLRQSARCFKVPELSKQEEELQTSLRIAGLMNSTENADAWELVLKTHREIDDTASRFSEVLNSKNGLSVDERQWLESKLNGAKKYFLEKMNLGIFEALDILRQAIKEKKQVKGLKKAYESYLKPWQVYRTKISNFNLPGFEIEKHQPKELPKISSKPVKGESQMLTLELVQTGKTIEEIATARNMATSTIEGHIISLIVEGALEKSYLLSEEAFAEIEKAIENQTEPGLGPVFNSLRGNYSYGQIILVNRLKKKAAEQENENR
ncbi:MAG: AAA family ATPase [Bacteroidetes bacterium]|nr:AAA family ATPase [Bacteroidota bacterium]